MCLSDISTKQPVGCPLCLDSNLEKGLSVEHEGTFDHYLLTE